LFPTLRHATLIDMSISGSLEGKVALITGGSRGIGLGIAQRFGASGAKLMLVSRKPDGLEAAAAELVAAGVPSENIAWESGNVGKAEDAQRCVDSALTRFGAVDVLVNNAATNPYAGPVIDVDIARWTKTEEVNLRGPLVWTQAAWHSYMKEHGGSVINISSVGGLMTSPALGVYDVFKCALMHLTRQLAYELAPKVRVNCLAPGLIKTDFAKYLWQDGKGDAVAQTYPLKRLGEPDDIGEAALYFAAGASWVTGQTLVLDGGGLIDAAGASHE
jgi:NAD(P)-dependent dehydrogenase (short-subunit alcohol dehydrogenase family)